MFEIQKQGEFQSRDAQISQHLSDVRLVEGRHHFCVYDNRRIHNQIRDQGSHQMPLVSDFMLLLLVDLHATFDQFDHQCFLVSSLIQPRLQFIEHRLGCSDDLFAQFFMLHSVCSV